MVDDAQPELSRDEEDEYLLYIKEKLIDVLKLDFLMLTAVLAVAPWCLKQRDSLCHN